MNTEQLRQSLKTKWLDYYRENRPWLVRLGVWVDSEGHRRPSSSFILATLSVLEPDLTQLLPLVVDLSSSPDRIVRALGLNFSPDKELDLSETGATGEAQSKTNDPPKLLPSGNGEINFAQTSLLKHPQAVVDESCRGIGSEAIE